MGREKDKEAVIRKALRNGPLWVREIARRSGLDKSTASRHLDSMSGLRFEMLGRNKVYRLK